METSNFLLGVHNMSCVEDPAKVDGSKRKVSKKFNYHSLNLVKKSPDKKLLKFINAFFM